MAVLTGNQPYQQPVYGQPGAATYSARGSMTRLSGVEGAGLLLLLLGAWGALVPFVGPAFGFSADGTGSWTWNAAHAWLFLVPGAVAALGGLLVMAGGAGAGSGTARIGAFVAVLAGAWFVVGPVALPILGGAHFFHGYGTLRQLEYWIGYSLGPGFLIGALASYVLGRPAAPTAVVAPAAATTSPVA